MRACYESPKARDLLYRAYPGAFSSRLDELEKARRLLEEAERIEPGQTHTYSALGWTWYFESRARWCSDPERAIGQAASYAERAIEVGDHTGMGYMLMATVHLKRRDYDRALEAGRIALDHRPGCPWAYAMLGNIYNYTGEPLGAIQLASRAIRLSPLVPDLFPAVVATGSYLLGRFEDAVTAAKSAMELDPESLDAHIILLAGLVASRHHGQVSSTVAEIRRLDPDFSLDAYARGQPYRNPAHLEGLLADLRRAGL